MNDLVAIANDGALQELPIGRYIMTFDPADKKMRALVASAVQGKPPSLADQVNTEIEIVNLLYHRIKLVDSETGEVKLLPRLCLFTRDGKVYSTSGEKAIKDALLPAQLFGLYLPYDPPQRFKVSKTKNRPDGGGYINLEWLGEGKR